MKKVIGAASALLLTLSLIALRAAAGDEGGLPATTEATAGGAIGAIERDIQSVESNRQQAMSDRAAKKLYPGGRDEQDLRPQASLPAPTRTAGGGNAPSVTVAAPEAPAD